MVELALRTKLTRARRYWAVLDSLEGVGWILLALGVAGLLCFHADRTFVLSPTTRIGLRWASLCLFLLGAARLVVWPLLRKRSDELIAIHVERRYPEFGERLLSTVEFEQADGVVPGTSPSMVRALADETAAMAEGVRFESAFSARKMMRSGILMAAVLAAWVVQVAVAPQAVAAWWQRMADPNAGVPVFRDTRVHVAPLERRLLRGGSLEVSITTEGRPVDSATLHFRFGDGAWSHVRLTEKGEVPGGSADTESAAGAGFRYRFEALNESVTYYATAGDGQSDPGRGEVVDAPAIVEMSLRYQYPAYMARAEEKYRGTSGSILAPVGTRVGVSLAANKPLSTARLFWGGREAGLWTVRDDHASGELLVRGSGRYGFRLKDTEQFESPRLQEFPIQAILDRTPEVQVTRPAGDRELVADGSLPLEGVARDDYGVESARLWYHVERGKREATLPLAKGGRQQRSLEVGARWNLGSLQLKPGDMVRYRVEAVDFDNITGPHVGKSPEYGVRILDRGEMERRLNEQRDQLQRQLEQLIREQKAARQAVEQARQAAKPQAAAAAEQQQRALGQQATEVAQRVSELSQALENNAMASQQELAQQQQAQQELSQIGQQAMPQAADQIAAAQAAPSPRQGQQDLQNATRQQQEIERRLEEIRRGMRGANDLERLAEQAERLAQAQRELQQQTQQMMPQTLGQTRRDLNAQQRTALDQLARAQNAERQATQQFEQRLNQAAQSQRQNDPNAAQAAQQAAQQMRQSGIPERQSQAEQQVSENALASAAQQQQQLAQELQQLANDLRQARENPGQTAEDRQRQAMQQQMQRLQQMLDRQRELKRLTRNNPDRKEAPRLQRRQQDLQQQAQRQAQQLQRQSQSQNAGMRASSSRASQRMQRAAQNMGRSAQSLSRNEPKESASEQEQAEQELAEAMQDLQRAIAENENERRREELRQRLAELSAQQKAIHGATSRVDQERQSNPPTEAQQRVLDQLARTQADVDQRAQRLDPQLPSKVFKDSMGRAREEMQRSEKGLQQRDSGSDTRDAQQSAQRILDRMARALEQGDDQSDQQQAGGGGGQQGGGQQMSPEDEEELRQRLADLKLLRGMEQALREETQELERQRAEGRELTPQQQQRLRELTERQRNARGMTQDAARGLGRFPRLSQRVGQAGESMQEAEGHLGQSQTGQPTQEAQAEAVKRLTEAIRQAQQQAQQMAQNRQRNRGQRPGQQQRQANNPNGNRPAIDSYARRGNGQGGRLNLVGPGPRGFGPLDPHGEQALRQGWRERIPTDYHDLVDRYYKALSAQGSKPN